MRGAGQRANPKRGELDGCGAKDAPPLERRSHSTPRDNRRSRGMGPRRSPKRAHEQQARPKQRRRLKRHLPSSPMQQICGFLATEPRSGTECAVSRPKRTIARSESPGRQNQRGKHDAETCPICARTRFRGHNPAIPPHEASRANEKGMRGRSWMRQGVMSNPRAALFGKRKRPSVPSPPCPPRPLPPSRAFTPPRIRISILRAPCGNRVERADAAEGPTTATRPESRSRRAQTRPSAKRPRTESTVRGPAKSSQILAQTLGRPNRPEPPRKPQSRRAAKPLVLEVVLATITCFSGS